MNRLIMQAVLLTILSPLAVAQSESTVLPDSSEAAAPAAHEASDVSQLSATAERMKAMKNARTVCIHSETVFLTVSTLERALMKQKDWDRLGLTIVGTGEGCSADLEIHVDRLHFTHIHTYVLTEERTGIVLAADRVRAIDGVVASGPMAEHLVKILSAARLPAMAASEHGL